MATIVISGPLEVCDEQTSEAKALDGAEEMGANLADYSDGDLAHLGIARGDLKLGRKSPFMPVPIYARGLVTDVEPFFRALVADVELLASSPAVSTG